MKVRRAVFTLVFTHTSFHGTLQVHSTVYLTIFGSTTRGCLCNLAPIGRFDLPDTTMPLHRRLLMFTLLPYHRSTEVKREAKTSNARNRGVL
ncbi:hypothetical protein M011DRAFT_162494 [Sporormia fimetaria CBS 119925]|uniref:Uncharacterized protein n=1 Tax=Sporormia fimetaria CBS 119925 TaxID=1340428 RepID=A0A6A6V3K7_9PLEO|nr:hypothetical protein M011DRAFT_162494 [Sporormia fimetaria CBS 119925]